jgi:hypothetical protein
MADALRLFRARAFDLKVADAGPRGNFTEPVKPSNGSGRRV